MHFEPGVWKEYADTANEHPAALVIRSIVRLYKQIGASTLVMPARWTRPSCSSSFTITEYQSHSSRLPCVAL